MEAGKKRFLKRWYWLVGAAALVVVAAWLMLEPEPAARANRQEIDFPRYPRAHELERQQRRRTLRTLPPASGSDAGMPDPALAQGRDPVHVALSGGEVAIVVEASTIRRSPVGEKLVACLSENERGGLGEARAKLGVDVLEDVDRIAISRGATDDAGVMVVSGDFENATWERVFEGRQPEAFGTGAKIYAGDEGPAFGIWNDEMVLIGTREEIERAVDRLEGRAAAPPPFADGEAYGEIYGIISGDSMAQLVPEELRERMREAADRVMLHVDTTDDLLVVADVYGEGQQAKDLATSIGAALAVARMKAVHDGDEALAELLDLSAVKPDATGFQMEMALPLEMIEQHLGECAR